MEIPDDDIDVPTMELSQLLWQALMFEQDSLRGALYRHALNEHSHIADCEQVAMRLLTPVLRAMVQRLKSTGG